MAIGNAVHDGPGSRVRTPPFTAENAEDIGAAMDG
jgi:CO/xanthine dehydrogenase Mo-binding subunit